MRRNVLICKKQSLIVLFVFSVAVNLFIPSFRIFEVFFWFLSLFDDV